MIPVNSLYKAKNYYIQSRRLLQWKTLYNFDTKEENYECCKDTTSPHIKVNQEGLFKRFFRKDTLKNIFYEGLIHFTTYVQAKLTYC